MAFKLNFETHLKGDRQVGKVYLMQNEKKEQSCGEIRLHSVWGLQGVQCGWNEVSLVWKTMQGLDHKARDLHGMSCLRAGTLSYE